MNETERQLDLVEKAQRGERAAFDELASSVAGRLLVWIRRRMAPGMRLELDPEDVLQETFLRAFRSIGRFHWQGPGSFEGWLHGIALRILLHAAREQGKSNALRIVEDPRAPGISPSRQQQREERFDRLEDSLSRLSREHRLVIRLARIEGLSISEISKRTKRTPGSVRSLLFRAMQQLRGAFGDTESLGLPHRSLKEDETDDPT